MQGALPVKSQTCQDALVGESSGTEPSRTYGGQSAEERTSGRRERLITATVTVLAEQGETRTTMTAICNTAGLTERYFYESFRNRDEALVAALDSICTEIADRVLTAISTTSGDAADRVSAAIQAIITLFDADRAKGRVVTIEATANPSLRARRQELIVWFAELATAEAAELFGEHAWPAERARLHGIVFIAGFTELIGTWLADEATASPDELVDIAAELFTAIARRP